jgi:hypothetical protein
MGTMSVSILMKLLTSRACSVRASDLNIITCNTDEIVAWFGEVQFVC